MQVQLGGGNENTDKLPTFEKIYLFEALPTSSWIGSELKWNNDKYHATHFQLLHYTIYGT